MKLRGYERRSSSRTRDQCVMGRLLGLQVRDACSNLVRVPFHKSFARLDSRNNLYAIMDLS